MWVMLAMRDNAADVVKVSRDYDDAAYEAVRLIRQILGDDGWFQFVQGDHMPNFAVGEWFSKDGLRVGVVRAEECQVFI
jgi:hypothetical protein